MSLVHELALFLADSKLVVEHQVERRARDRHPVASLDDEVPDLGALQPFHETVEVGSVNRGQLRVGGVAHLDHAPRVFQQVHASLQVLAALRLVHGKLLGLFLERFGPLVPLHAAGAARWQVDLLLGEARHLRELDRFEGRFRLSEELLEKRPGGHQVLCQLEPQREFVGPACVVVVALRHLRR